MKQFKKIFAGILTLCVLFTFMPAAFAADSTYELQGDANLFAPQIGRKAEVPYTLIDTATGNAVTTGVSLSISGENVPAGVSVKSSGTAIILDGTTIKNGTFTLTATYNGETVATKAVTVEDARHYYDFAGQNADVNPTANPTKLSDGTELSSIIPNQKAKTAKESNGNTYVNATAYNNYFAVKPQNATNAWTSARYITVEFDMINPTGTTFFKENKEYEVQLYAKNNKLYSKKDGDELAAWNFSSTEWTKFQVVFDYYNYKYTIITESETFGPYNMLKTTDSNNYAEILYFERAVDNIAIYSGKPATAEVCAINGNSSLLAPPVGQTSTLKYTMTGAADAVWSIAEATHPGLSLSAEGVLTLNGTDIKAGKYTINAVAEGGMKVGTKTITVEDIRFFEDFSDKEEGNTGKITLSKLSAATQDEVSFFNGGQYVTADGTNMYCGIASDKSNIATLPRWKAYDAYKEPSVVTVSFKVKGGRGSSMMVNGSNILYIATGGQVGFDSSNLTDARVASDEWSEVRVTMNFATRTYSVWADDCLAIKDRAIPAVANGDYYTGLVSMNFYFPIDDLAIYSGEKVVADAVTVDGAVYADDALKAEGTHSVKVVKSGVANAGDTPALILAEYNGGTLETIKITNLSAGTLGEYILSSRLGNIEAGHTVKVFLWNMGVLVPIEASVELD